MSLFQKSMTRGLVSRESGFSLVSAMVSMAVVSIVGLSLMKFMSSQMKASAAVQLDMDRESVKRSILQRQDCQASRPLSLPKSGTDVIAIKTKSGRIILPALADGVKIGRFHYRALVDRSGDLTVESRMLNSKGQVAHHPLLTSKTSGKKSSGGLLELDWAPLFPVDAPLCSFELESIEPDDLKDPLEDDSAQLVYFPSGRFQAQGGDVLVEVEYISNGGFSCRNELVFTEGCPTTRLSHEGQKLSFVLKKNAFCRVQVKSTTIEGSAGSCTGGLISSANGLTVKQGVNLWRIQWEDRLPQPNDSALCKREQKAQRLASQQSACNRLKAVDWNDAIWHIRGQPVSAKSRFAGLRVQ